MHYVWLKFGLDLDYAAYAEAELYPVSVYWLVIN